MEQESMTNSYSEKIIIQRTEGSAEPHEISRELNPFENAFYPNVGTLFAVNNEVLEVLSYDEETGIVTVHNPHSSIPRFTLK
ncbi:MULTISPECIES: hypothetical protein [unclassified Sporosarcina]|uniref:hypothetical protein n=1 Tax=unclassified Sporosarcina TaxID=2647733 RepID=UPI001A927F8D|nr:MULTISPECIES: hypothetical protein [unclassified Sporosarcina]MBO0588174.1 hypothetical protein [Sporosarcina sp. E16_8]MBO0601928.1 hypothetical protein [Sporosarcina sp. E16_3]